MNALTTIPQAIADVPAVTWQEAIEPFFDTLDSHQTRRAYRSSIAEVMQRLKVAFIDEITTPLLTNLGTVTRSE